MIHTFSSEIQSWCQGKQNGRSLHNPVWFLYFERFCQEVSFRILMGGHECFIELLWYLDWHHCRPLKNYRRQWKLKTHQCLHLGYFWQGAVSPPRTPKYGKKQLRCFREILMEGYEAEKCHTCHSSSVQCTLEFVDPPFFGTWLEWLRLKLQKCVFFTDFL